MYPGRSGLGYPLAGRGGGGVKVINGYLITGNIVSVALITLSLARCNIAGYIIHDFVFNNNIFRAWLHYVCIFENYYIICGCI